MIIYTPIATGQFIDPRVTAGIAMQTIPCEHRIFDSPGVINSQRVHTPESDAAQCVSRNLCMADMSTIQDDYVVMMDKDVVFTKPTAVADMLAFMEANPSVNGGALWFEGPPKNTRRLPHINMRCAIYKREAIAGQKMVPPCGTTCCCILMKDQVLKGNFEYIDFVNRAIELT